MNSVKESSVIFHISPLWLHLGEQLADVLDAHGVCAAAAQSLSEFVEARVIVALKDPLLQHLDVWICEPSAATIQTRWRRATKAIDELIDSGIPATLTDTNDIWEILVDQETLSDDFTSILAAPIPLPARNFEHYATGAILVIDPPGDIDFELDHLGYFASQVTIYLDRASLRQRSDRQSVEFGLVSDIGYSITSKLELDKIANLVADATRQALGTEHISIGLIESSRDELVFIRSIMDQPLRSQPRVRLKIGTGIAGWVAENDTPALVNDAYADDRFYPNIDAQTGLRTKSVLCVPLHIEGSVIGVVEAINKSRGLFDEDDLRLLQAITGPLAVAIQNAGLHNSVVTEKRRVETIFASMSEGMLTANRDGVVTAVNDALYTMLEYKAGNMIGSSLNDVISTRQAGFSEFIDVVEIDDSPFQQLICDVQMQDGGYLPVIISGSSIQQDNGEVEEFVFVFSNLTEIREIERMRDDFFNNIVHELRTPLATILMYARLLRSGDIDKDSEKKARFLDTIEQESNRLQIMVRQMLHLAKLQAAQTQRGEESTPLNPVFDQILPPLAERAAVKGLVFRQDIEQNLLEVQCDEDTLYLIFKNLIENAIKFTPEGVVSVGAHLDGEWVRVEIVDEGIGIPPEGLPNLFSRYYRAQTAVEKGIAGTGLGLHLVKEGLDHCGGTIEVRSKPGLGTTIITQIPRTLKS